MEKRLSKSRIISFCGDVLPLWLISDGNEEQEDIEWSVYGDTVGITELSDCTDFAVNNGVLLTLTAAGESYVIAKCSGTEYKCKVISREMRTLTETDKICFFRGNFHDHTSNDHNPDTFPKRQTGLPRDYITKIKNENLLDCSSITDHAILLTKKNFFETFVAVEEFQPMEQIIFAGNESDVSVIETDRFGVRHKNGGEVVVINADNYVSCESWQEFIDAYKNFEYAVGIFAHPQEMGGGKDGIWNFDFKNKYSPELAKLMRGIEVGNGYNVGSNAVNEYSFSCALDAGFRVSTVSSCDHHGPENWGYKAYPAKTVIMAYEKSKEAFLDALYNLRFYASESANIKLLVKVNGKNVPCDLDMAEKYDFSVNISCFEDDETSIPIRCDVISNNGKTVKSIENVDFSNFDFSVKSNEAEYFYLRFVDSKERRTWSPPVFTGRRNSDMTEKSLFPIEKQGFTVTELLTDTNVDVLANNDVYDTWDSNLKKAELLVDMKGLYDICAVGIYSPRCISGELKAAGDSLKSRIDRFVSGYKIFTSVDGECFTEQISGVVRVFGNEEIISFNKTSARYVKFCAISTVGMQRGLEDGADATLNIAELSVYTN